MKMKRLTKILATVYLAGFSLGNVNAQQLEPAYTIKVREQEKSIKIMKVLGAEKPIAAVKALPNEQAKFYGENSKFVQQLKRDNYPANKDGIPADLILPGQKLKLSKEFIQSYGLDDLVLEALDRRDNLDSNILIGKNNKAVLNNTVELFRRNLEDFLEDYGSKKEVSYGSNVISQFRVQGISNDNVAGINSIDEPSVRSQRRIA